MSNTLIRGAFAIAILTVGVAMIGYAGHVAYQDADTDLEAVDTLHPVIETGIYVLPWLIPVLLGIAVIGGTWWAINHALGSDPGSGSGGAFR